MTAPSLASRLAAALAIAAPSLSGQSLAVSELVARQPAVLTVTGAAPLQWQVHVASLAGIGAGPCSPAHGLCLDVLAPIALGLGPADAAGTAVYAFDLPAVDVPFGLAFQSVGLATTAPLPKTNAVAITLHPISYLDDDFPGSALGAGWSVLNGALATIAVQNGELAIEPLTAGLPNMWYQDGEGVLVWRPLHGDFAATARLVVEDPANPGMPPPPGYRLAGIMARAPGSTTAAEDYVHVALGSASSAQPIVAEDKSTDDSVSDWLAHPVAGNAGEIRLERSGSTFRMLHRVDPTQPWQLLRTHSRPDLPPTLQVGLMAYANSGPPQVRARIDWLRFE